MDLKTVLVAIVVAILFFLGIIFTLASAGAPSRLFTAAIFFIVGLALIVVFAIANYLSRGPKTIIQRLELSGEMKAVELKCPNCSASVDARKIKIVSGVPYGTCPYCGQTFEVTEEPKW